MVKKNCMKKLLCTLIILGTTLVAVAACSPPSVKQPLKVEIVQDTKCNVIWVDVKGLSEITLAPPGFVPLGEGFWNIRENSYELGQETPEEIKDWDTYYVAYMPKLTDYKIDVSRGWEKQNGNYFFAIDSLDWSEVSDSQSELLTVTVWDKGYDGVKGTLNQGSLSIEVEQLSGEPNRGEGCRPPAEELESLVENTATEKSEPADENPLKAEFHLSEGDVLCGFFFIDVFGLNESKKPLGPSLTATIDGKPAAGTWVVPDEKTDYDGFFEINEWPESLTDGTYSVTAALDDGTNTFTLTKDLTLNACE